MRPTVSQYAATLEELASELSGAAESQVGRNLIGWLRRRGELKKLPAILESLERLEAEKKNTVAVTVTTAHAVAGETKRRLEAKAESLFPGKQVTLTYVVDEACIGGALFRSDELLYDATLRTRLNELKKALQK